MSEYTVNQRQSEVNKLISNARAIISHQVAIPLGCQKMIRIIHRINNIFPLDEIDLNVFFEFDRDTRNLPIGTERLSYNKDYLLSEDFKLDKITAKFKNDIILKCFDIIKLQSEI